MFGNNPVRKKHVSSGITLDITELFLTIQGEGPFAGQPAIFVRLWGCNLQCHFCDTDFESNKQTWHTTSIVDNIMAFKNDSECDLVVITGGEPMRQNILPLVEILIAQGYRVQIETAGTLWVTGLEDLMTRNVNGSNITIVCSPKTGKVNKNINLYCNDWKYIISECSGVNISEKDGLPLSSTQIIDRKCAIARPKYVGARIYLQPCDEQDDVLNKQNIDLVVKIAAKYDYRVCLQLHKILGVE